MRPFKKYYHRSALKMNILTKILILAFFILLTFYLGYKFSKYFEYQNPISIRSPFKRVYLYENSKKIEPLKPTPTPTVTPKKEVKSQDKPFKAQILPFPKYLTDNGAKNRERILAWASQKYSGDELIALDNLLKKEAGYREDAINEIGACGIGQALPCEKMGCPLDQSGLECQFNWVVKYITNRYGTPSKAWDHHLARNWY